MTEDDKVRKVPATFVNRWHIAAGPTIMRLSFGEFLGDGAKYHHAVVLTVLDALELAKAIIDTARLATGGQDGAHDPEPGSQTPQKDTGFLN